MRKFMKSMLVGSAVIMIALAQPILADEPVCEPNGGTVGAAMSKGNLQIVPSPMNH